MKKKFFNCFAVRMELVNVVLPAVKTPLKKPGKCWPPIQYAYMHASCVICQQCTSHPITFMHALHTGVDS